MQTQTATSPALPLSPAEQRLLPYFDRNAIERTESALARAGYDARCSVTLVSASGVSGYGPTPSPGTDEDLSALDGYRHRTYSLETGEGICLLLQVERALSIRGLFAVTVDAQEIADRLGNADVGLHVGVWEDLS